MGAADARAGEVRGRRARTGARGRDGVTQAGREGDPRGGRGGQESGEIGRGRDRWWGGGGWEEALSRRVGAGGSALATVRFTRYLSLSRFLRRCSGTCRTIL